MKTTEPTIREIQPEDNQQIATVIRSVLIELNVPKVGTAYEDAATDLMFESYQKEKAVYFVIEKEGKIIGGAGISQLDNYDGNICEFQKMYFLPETRGLGLGTKLINACLKKAKEFGYEQCYLETMPYMTAAQKLYKKNGFKQINTPMGNTCHYSCDVWMIRKL